MYPSLANLSTNWQTLWQLTLHEQGLWDECLSKDIPRSREAVWQDCSTWGEGVNMMLGVCTCAHVCTCACTCACVRAHACLFVNACVRARTNWYF